MSIESVNIFVQNDNPARDGVPGVVVRVFDATGTHFITQATTDGDGEASLSLVAPSSYQVRFFKEQFSIPQPQQVNTLPAPAANDFNAVGHVYSPPEAVHPRMCRCSGFFKKPDNSPAVGHDVQVIAKFDPILFEGMAMLTERLRQRTDHRGYAQFDLVRFGEYDVTVEGMEDCVRRITVPDAPSVNLPDLLFPVVTEIDFDIEGPYSIGEGVLNDFVITPTVRTSDGRVLPGTAIVDVRWGSSDPNVLAVLPSATTITLRGLRAGTAQLTAIRADTSIIRIPNPPIDGVPVEVTVS